MKKVKRNLCLVLTLVMLLAIPVHAGEVSQRSSSYITAYDSHLYKVSSTQFEVWFNILGAGTMEEIGVSEIRVQRSSSSNGPWTTVKTYRAEDYPQMIATNDFSHVDCVTYTGASGYYYRAVVTFYGKKGNGSGVVFDYAETIYL